MDTQPNSPMETLETPNSSKINGKKKLLNEEIAPEKIDVNKKYRTNMNGRSYSLTNKC
jgi:hypothetical protein